MIDSLRFDLEEWQAWHAGFLTIDGASAAISAECNVANTRQILAVSFVSNGSFIARSTMSGDGALCDTIALLCIDAGVAQLDIGGGQLPVREGDILVLNTAERFAIHADNLAATMVCVPRTALGADTRHAVPSFRILEREREAVGLLAGVLGHIASRTIETAEGRGEAIDIVGACLRIACRINASSDTGQDGAARAVHSELIQLIDDNLAGPQLTAGWIADQLGISKASVYRQFSSLGGLAATIRNRRLDCALEDMTSRSGRRENLDVVAVRYGFSNRSVFSRAFTKRFGVSPIAIAKSSPDAGRAAAKIARTLHHNTEPNLHFWMMENTMRALLARKAEV